LRTKRIVYRTYRTLKNRLQGKTGLPTQVFFRLLRVAEYLLSENRKIDPRQDRIWEEEYKTRHGGGPLFHLQTNHPVALGTTDHQLPRGAIRDSTTHPPFNRALKRLFPGVSYRVLDLGCAGGGMVGAFLREGVEAVGIEGSDHPRRLGLGEWRRCPLHLFTCDITEQFFLRGPGGEIAKFDVVTAWEVLEHIPEDKLDGLISNICRHLKQGGYFIASVDQTPDMDPLTGAVYHQTLHPKDWWMNKFSHHGFREVRGHPFRTEDYVRGNAVGIKDWDPAAGDGFHLVLRLE
jgi:2-polyprenyl-3-methyl-5-hydroxy-6-metoxy-1,4-benzoquinol methylase